METSGTKYVDGAGCQAWSCTAGQNRYILRKGHYLKFEVLICRTPDRFQKMFRDTSIMCDARDEKMTLQSLGTGFACPDEAGCTVSIRTRL
jgi:hypothetical protein